MSELDQLKNHEEKCPERIDKCPKCKAVVQLKKFVEHVQENECWTKFNCSTFIHAISRGFMEWDGLSKNRGQEFDLDKVRNSWIYNGKGNIFIRKKYISESRICVFAVMMAKNPEEIDQYYATITIYTMTMILSRPAAVTNVP